MQFYKGNRKIKFFLFSDENPKDYLPEGTDCEYIHTTNSNWVDGTNLKFKSILSLKDKKFYSLNSMGYSNQDFINNEITADVSEDIITHYFYFDADTNISREFTEEWFLGESVAGQHYADQSWMKERKGFERNPRSKAYVPLNTSLPEVYTYGAFWGGTVEWVMKFCQIMLDWQKADKSWGYEPSVNDESFSNAYFHYNPPSKLVATQDFAFDISDKGGIGETRKINLDISKLKKDLILYKDHYLNIAGGVVIPSIEKFVKDEWDE